MNPRGRSALCCSTSSSPRRSAVAERGRWVPFFAFAFALAGCSAGSGDGHRSFFDGGAGGDASKGEAGRRDGGFDADTLGTTPDATTGTDASPSTDGDSPIDSTIPIPTDSNPPGADARLDSADADLGPDDSSVVTDTPSLDASPERGDSAVTPDVAISDDAAVDTGARVDTGMGADTGVDASVPDASAGCTVGGDHYSPGGFAAATPCQTCQPTLSTTAFTQAPDGTTCGGGSICVAGSCSSECDIDGLVYPSGAVDPGNPCEACQPSQSTSAWTNQADGTTCGSGQVCSAGACSAQCDIGGMFFAGGTPGPGVCQACQPTVSTTAWSNLPDGTACNGAGTCQSGSCVGGCVIGGTTYPSGSANPENPCQACEPAQTTTAWTTKANGSSCGAGFGNLVCSEGICDGCSIGGNPVAAGTLESSGNQCMICNPSMSATSWTTQTCTAGQECTPEGTCCTPLYPCQHGNCTYSCTENGFQECLGQADGCGNIISCCQ